MDKERLIKFLNLTTSSTDGEALSAIRKANIFLKENNINWEEIILLFDNKRNRITDKQYVEFAIINMNLKKECAYSDDLKERMRGYKNFIIFLFIIIVILIIGIIIK